MSDEVLIALLSLVPAIVTGFLTYVIAKRKSDGEIAHLAADTERIQEEMERLRLENLRLRNELRTENIAPDPQDAAGTAQADSTPPAPTVIYDASVELHTSDFRSAWPAFADHLTIVNGTIVGFSGTAAYMSHNYPIYLRRYLVEGVERDFIPKTKSGKGTRRLHLRCQVQKSASLRKTPHQGTVHFYAEEYGVRRGRRNRLETKPITLRGEEQGWVDVDLPFTLPASLDIVIGFYLPMSVGLRDIVLTERH